MSVIYEGNFIKVKHALPMDTLVTVHWNMKDMSPLQY